MECKLTFRCIVCKKNKPITALSACCSADRLVCDICEKDQWICECGAITDSLTDNDLCIDCDPNGSITY